MFADISEYNPVEYLKMIEPLLKDEADVVYGSRFADQRNNGNFLLLSFIANKTLTLLTNILFGAKLTA